MFVLKDASRTVRLASFFVIGSQSMGVSICVSGYAFGGAKSSQRRTGFSRAMYNGGRGDNEATSTFREGELMNPWRLWVGRLLVISGAFLTIAIVPVFFPVELMKQCHQWLGLGEMQIQPVTVYLARSTSLLYFVHGVVTVYVGWHVERLWPMVRVLGVLHVMIGLTMIYVDLNAGMPWYWTWGEGAPVALLGGLILFMWSRGESSSDCAN